MRPSLSGPNSTLKSTKKSKRPEPNSTKISKLGATTTSAPPKPKAKKHFNAPSPGLPQVPKPHPCARDRSADRLSRQNLRDYYADRLYNFEILFLTTHH